MGVVDGDGNGWIPINGKIVKVSDSQGNITKAGQNYIINEFLMLSSAKSKGKYINHYVSNELLPMCYEQTCVLFNEDEYRTQLTNLSDIYKSITKARIEEDSVSLGNLFAEKDELVKKLQTEYINPDFADHFEKEIETLDLIVYLI